MSDHAGCVVLRYIVEAAKNGLHGRVGEFGRDPFDDLVVGKEIITVNKTDHLSSCLLYALV